MKNIAVIICAAGASSRFGGKTKKPFVAVAGRAAFLRSIDFFEKRDDVKQIILAISPEDDELVRVKWEAAMAFSGVKLCHGGAERFETVRRAIEFVKDDIELIAVHDAVRCCLTDKWLDELFERAAEAGAAMLACPIVGTVKKVADGVIIETVDRTGLYEAQTPQVFSTDVLKKAYEKLAAMSDEQKARISDDAMLAEAIGQKIAIVETDRSNLKITKQNDVPIAEAIIKARPKPKPDGPTGPYAEAVW